MGSTLDPDNFPAGKTRRKIQKGHDTRSLGPSDSSDSGSDMAGPSYVDDDADRDVDRIVGADEAGLGGGLDQAEEAQQGITDEEIEQETGTQDDLFKPRKP
jgi:hypothetical protein